MPVSSLEAVEYGEYLGDLQDESTCHQNSILDCIRNHQLVDIHIARLTDAVSPIESLFLFQGSLNAMSRPRRPKRRTNLDGWIPPRIDKDDVVTASQVET